MRITRQSQSCTAGSRLFLHRDIFDSFLDALGQKVKALKLGDPLDEASDIGTIINEKQFNKVCRYVEEGLNRPEALVVVGGLPPKEGPLSEGYYAIPTIFANVAVPTCLATPELIQKAHAQERHVPADAPARVCTGCGSSLLRVVRRLDLAA
jgi:betaine-aldehyde dehydrogenase